SIKINSTSASWNYSRGAYFQKIHLSRKMHPRIFSLLAQSQVIYLSYQCSTSTVKAAGVAATSSDSLEQRRGSTDLLQTLDDTHLGLIHSFLSPETAARQDSSGDDPVRGAEARKREREAFTRAAEQHFREA
ncbi:unnamed protein product, partial [Amoebophrya sp. A120]